VAHVAAFYRFARFRGPELPPLRDQLLALGREHGVLGTILLAEEGINGTISGPEVGVEAVLAIDGSSGVWRVCRCGGGWRDQTSRRA
jgi:predicted sulfurtransferase